VLRLAHAYALSVDKSQGSEWPYVIYFIPRFTGSNFINRNRNYTAMTRAQNACYNVVPSLSQLEQTVVVKPNQRPARFKERLIAALPHITPFEIKFAWEQVTEDTGEDEIPDWCYER
jgi:exodeoxyribonuclease V alpha subunit